MKTFIEIIKAAEENDWCVNPFCTTCGSREFKDELRKLSEEHESGFIDALCAADLSDLQSSSNWRDALRITLGQIDDVKDMDKVLKAWLPNLQSNIPLADFVLFYFCRGGLLFSTMSGEVLGAWVDTCKQLAIKTKNESLIESLIYTLPEGIKYDQELMEVIKLAAVDSGTIRRAIATATG
jgi:hypothetical protein